jgi:hypothetical protein
MKRGFAEIGIGNNSFISTEIEEREKEYRINKLIMPNKINGVYIRIWFLKRVLVLSTYDGIKLNRKNKNRFKFLLGVEGVN